MENLCRLIQERLFNIPSHPRSLLDDLEVCIGGIDSIESESASASEISLSKEMIITIGRCLGNEERTKSLVSSAPVSDGIFGEQLAEQLVRHGMHALAYADYVFHFVMALLPVNFFLSKFHVLGPTC